MEALLHGWAQTAVRLNSVGKERVAARLRLFEQVDERNTRGLCLIGNVRVPGNGGCVSLKVGTGALIASCTVDEVDLWEPCR